MKKIAYYITAHGYGHGARSCDVLNALHTANPDVPIIAKTDLPADFMASRIPPGIEVRAGAFDVGLIQKDSIQVDLDASIETVAQLYSREDELVAQEVEFIGKEDIGVVVADIPAIPLAAAQRAGIPNIATGNFGWDWIYSEFTGHDPRWQTFVDKFAQTYRETDLLLRQPFAEPMAAFPNQIDLPLLAKPGKECRKLLAETTGADPAKPWVLLSFTTLNLANEAIARFSHIDMYEIFTVEPLEWPGSGIHALLRSTAPFADVLASVDIVVTKPGFGILSECIANDKPIIYSDRENFREYPILVEAIERYCKQAFIPNAELYAGDLDRVLEAIKTAPEPGETMPRGGAELAAGEILKRINRRGRRSFP